MNRVLVISAAILFTLTGCETVKTEGNTIVAPADPIEQTRLLEVWQNEVAEDVAILRAIQPSIKASEPVMSLYDSATQGLTSLAGEPTAKDVDKFKALISKPDPKVLEKLRAEKIALDKKTDALEAAVNEERDRRIRAEAAEIAAREDAKQAAIEARKAQAVGLLTKVGAGAVAIGVLSLLFGSYINLSKLTAGIVIGAGLCVAVTASWLVDLAEMKWIMIGLASFLGLDLISFIAIKTWRTVKSDAKETT